MSKYVIKTYNADTMLTLTEYGKVTIKVTGPESKGPIDVVIKSDYSTLSVDLLSPEGDVVGETAVDWSSLFDPDFTAPGWLSRVYEMTEQEMGEIWDAFTVSATGTTRYPNLLAAVKIAQGWSIAHSMAVDVWHMPTSGHMYRAEGATWNSK